jgi:hypothetical protein
MRFKERNATTGHRFAVELVQHVDASMATKKMATMRRRDGFGH